MEKQIYNSREWLNPKDSNDSGLMHSKISVDSSDDEDDDWYYVYAGLSLWDCSRKITLDFGFNDIKGAKERVQKIDKIIQELTNIKAVLGVAYEDMLEKQ